MKIARLSLVVLLTLMLPVQAVLLYSRFACQQGIDHAHEADWDRALAAFERAESAVPDFLSAWFAARDLYRINLEAGKALNEKGNAFWSGSRRDSRKAFAAYLSARTRLGGARNMDPAAYEAAYWLARTEAALELIHDRLYPDKKSPYNADPLYQDAIRLRPNGITILYSYARYLAHQGETGKLTGMIRRMAETYPPVYDHLKKETFFNDDLAAAAAEGLLAARENGVTPREAGLALADALDRRGDHAEAAAEYRAALDIRPFANRWPHYIRMGELLARSARFRESREWFLKGFKTADNFESALNRTYHFFRQQDQLDEFIRLATSLEKELSTPPDMDLSIARAWMELENDALAKARLLKLTAHARHPEATFLLARIAQHEQEWDRMELLAQKATVQDRENYRYHHLFSVALLKQEKYPQAEDAATKALENADKDMYWLFAHRAWTRWAQKKYGEAALDWKRALVLKPDHPDFPFRIALCYERSARFEEARIYAAKALELDPDSAGYRDLHQRLKKYK